jgi:hypothetical protein
VPIGNFRNTMPCRFSQLPRSTIADVFLVGHEDFVARLQVEPVGHEVRSHGRVLNERDLARRCVHQRRDFRAQLFLFAIAGNVLRVLQAVVVMRDRLFDLAHVRGHDVHHRARNGAEGGGVAVGLVAGDVELTAKPAPEIRIAGGRPGNRSRRNRRDIFRERPEADRGHGANEIAPEHGAGLSPIGAAAFSGLGRDPLVRPFADCVEGRGEGTTLFGEGVLDAHRRLGDHRALDDPFLLELLQALAQHAVRDPGDRVAESGVAAAGSKEQKDDGTRPLAPDELDRALERFAEGRGVIHQ